MEQGAAPTPRVAGFGSRFAAGLIDLAIVLTVSVIWSPVADAIVYRFYQPTGNPLVDIQAAVMIPGMADLAAGFGYFLLCWSPITQGRTLGKMALRLRVVRSG